MLSKKEKEVQITTILGSNSEIEGDFSATGSARIDGTVNGNVTLTGTLIVGATGNIVGNITADSVIIGGDVQGDVNVTEKTELTATAKVIGDITTKIIVIDENAIFQGGCNMNQSVSDKRAKGRVAKAARAGKKSAKDAIAEALKEVAEEEKRDSIGAELHAAEQTASGSDSRQN